MHETYAQAVAKLPKDAKPCDHESFNGNVDDPDYAYCVLPKNHGGNHDHRVTW